MNAIELIPYFLENADTYLLVLLPIVFVYGLLFYRLIRSIFDPLFWFVIALVFSDATVVFLFSSNFIEEYFLYYHFLCQVVLIGLFWVTYGVLKIGLGEKENSNKYRTDSTQFITSLFYLSSIAYLISKGLEYSFVGIPFFTRTFDLAGVGSGLGALSRIAEGSFGLFLFSLLFLLDKKRLGRLAWILAGAIMFLVLLSGSRSVLLVLLQLSFCYMYFYKNDRSGKYWGISSSKLFLIIALVAITTFVAQNWSGDNLLQALASPFIRFAYYGDIYIYAYVDHGIDILPTPDFYRGVVAPILAIFRLEDPALNAPHIGYAFYNHFNPEMGYAGPNARYDVLGLYYFGEAGGMVLAGILGILAGIARYSLVKFTGGLVKFILLMTVYNLAFMFIADLPTALSSMVSMLITIPILLLGTYLLVSAAGIAKQNKSMVTCNEH